MQDDAVVVAQADFDDSSEVICTAAVGRAVEAAVAALRESDVERVCAVGTVESEDGADALGGQQGSAAEEERDNKTVYAHGRT